MRTEPRLLGLRLQTLGVMASNGCSGWPNAGRDSGCTCHSMLAWVRAGLLRAKQPRVEGGMVMGPLRCSANCTPIMMRVRGLRYKLFTVLQQSIRQLQSWCKAVNVSQGENWVGSVVGVACM